MKTIVRILTTAAAVMMFANFANAQQHLCYSTVSNVKSYEATTLAPLSSVAWTITGGVTITNSTSTTCSIEWDGVAAGSYTLTLTETHESGLCTEVATLLITVHTAPTANFVLASSTACSGDLGEVIANISSDSDWTLSYTLGGVAQPAITGTSADVSYDFAPTVGATMTYVLTGITNLGCTGSITAETTHVVTPVVLAPTITPL